MYFTNFLFKQKHLEITIEKYRRTFKHSMHYFHLGLMNAILRQKKVATIILTREPAEVVLKADILKKKISKNLNT